MEEADSLGLSTKHHYVTISELPENICILTFLRSLACPFLSRLSRSFCHFYHDHRFLTYASRELLFNQVKNMIERFENLLLSL